ncbi:MAG: DUF2199 domain-containing protein [Caulobacteraceae bacterium]
MSWLKMIRRKLSLPAGAEMEPPSWVCSECGQVHEGLPVVAMKSPAAWDEATPEERDKDFVLTSDTCVWKGEHFFVRCVLEIPVSDRPETFDFGVWSTLSEANFGRYVKDFNSSKLVYTDPMFGWFSNQPPGYPDTLNLKCHVHPRSDGLRPLLELDATDHLLAVQQRSGISFSEALAYVHAHMSV